VWRAALALDPELLPARRGAAAAADTSHTTATAAGQYETRLLESAVFKVCALLAVGFGEAGARVIADNMAAATAVGGGGGGLNPMVPGKRTVRVGVLAGRGVWWGGDIRDGHVESG
jgi:hypothetical protein